MAVEGQHLLENRQEHQLAQRDLPSTWQLDEATARIQGDRDDLCVADSGFKGRLDVVGTDNENLPVRIGADEHSAVKAWWRREIASWQRAANLLLDHVFPGRSRAATEIGKRA
jgi:hypothetical protein